MGNPAKTDFDIHPFLKDRYSPRAFLDKPIDLSSLRTIFEAARWSPSRSNEQEWSFLVGIRNIGTAFERILSILTEKNQRWARFASVLSIVCGRELSADGVTRNSWFAYDCGQSVAHLTFQAVAEGVFVHQMAGFDARKTIEEFNVPRNIVPLTAIAMGYPADPSTLPPDLASRETGPRTRRPQTEFIFGEAWGKALE
jgi:nitroreductase